MFAGRFLRGGASSISTTAKRTIMGEKLIPLCNPFGKTPYLELPPRDGTTKQPGGEVNLCPLHKHMAEQSESELPRKMPSAEPNPLGKNRETLVTEKIQVLGMKMGKREFDDMTKEFALTEEAWNPLVEAMGDVRPERNDEGETVTNRSYSCSRD